MQNSFDLASNIMEYRSKKVSSFLIIKKEYMA